MGFPLFVTLDLCGWHANNGTMSDVFVPSLPRGLFILFPLLLALWRIFQNGFFLRQKKQGILSTSNFEVHALSLSPRVGVMRTTM